MGKPKSSKTTEPAALGLGGLMAPQAAPLWEAQEKVLEECAGFTSRWIDRRQKAVSAMSEGSDQGSKSVPEALQTWQRASMEIMAEDVSDWLMLWSTCANLIRTGEIEAECEIIGLDKGKDKLPTRIPV